MPSALQRRHSQLKTKSHFGSTGSPLPDLIPSADTKWQSPCRDLRVRRGLDPIPRFRLNSVGSASGSSTASSPASTPCTPVSPSPINFDLITPSSSASTATYHPSPSTHFYYPPSPPASASTAAPLPSEWPAAESETPADDVADGSDCSAEWRRVGRELRSIADSFASARPPTQVNTLFSLIIQMNLNVLQLETKRFFLGQIC